MGVSPAMSTRTIFLSALLAGATVPRIAAAFNPATDVQCVSETAICLTSFKWCDNGGSGCSYPDGADALIPGANLAPYAVLYHGKSYQITWKQAVPNVPVMIEWLFGIELYSDPPDDMLDVRWSTNTTNSSYAFSPRTILLGFPTPHAPNMSVEAAIAAAHGVSNHIRISQPEAPGDAASVSMMSDQFLVHTKWTAQIVRNLREHDLALYAQQQRNWQTGVGVGVGVGLPLVATVAWVLGHRGGTRAGYLLANKLARQRAAD